GASDEACSAPCLSLGDGRYESRRNSLAVRLDPGIRACADRGDTLRDRQDRSRVATIAQGFERARADALSLQPLSGICARSEAAWQHRRALRRRLAAIG